MNLLTPIPNAEFQLAVACLVLLIIVLFFIYTIKLFRRIEEVREDMIKEDEAREKQVLSMLAATNRFVDLHQSEIKFIKSTLNRPLYEVGNTIWYNRGASGEPGVHLDYKGEIIGIVENPNAEPDYLVNSNEGLGFTISQRNITAWTN